jgi:hypothetical protein
MQIKLLITTLVFILSQSSGIAVTQRITKSKYEVILRTNEGTIRTWVSAEKKGIRPKPDRFYYGYYLQGLFCKQGELQGKPLNGEFQRYDLKDNILESGRFRYGLKEGLWRQLAPDGTLTESSEYKKGLLNGQRIIYKNGKPNLQEKYKRGKLIGKPKYLNPLIEQERGETKIEKIKKMFHKLIKRKDNKSNVEFNPKNQKIIDTAKSSGR